MRNKTYLLTIFIIGILLRLYPIITKTLWLDEIYSLYFASNFSVLQILFRLPDCHPGLFYLLLKGLMAISLNPIFLRLFVSSIPELIGCIIIQKKFKKPLLTTIFLLNPFFIYSTSQIRMYGLVFLLSIIIFYLISSKRKSVVKIILSIFIANLISYSFIIPSLCFLIYLAFTHQKKWIFVIPLVLIEFFVFKGPQFKTFAETASWISLPTFNNTSSVILTSLAFAPNVNSPTSANTLQSLLFYAIFGFLTYKLSKTNSGFFFTFFMPLLIIIFSSIFFPILSQHRFFYHFTPKLSLFLPRFLLPLSIVFYFYIFKYISRHLRILFLCLLILIWIPVYISLNIYSPNKSAISDINNQQDSSIVFLPPSDNLQLPKKYTLKDIQNISKIYDSTELLEKQLIQNPPVCTLYSQYHQVTLIEHPFPSLKNYHSQIISALKTCANLSLQSKSLDK